MSNVKSPHFGKITPCICPRCGNSHRLRLFWTGRGVPRKYCQSCQKAVNYNEYEYINEKTLFDGGARHTEAP